MLFIYMRIYHCTPTLPAQTQQESLSCLTLRSSLGTAYS